MNFTQLNTPAYILKETELKNNLQKFLDIQTHTGCKIILALKAFATYKTFPLFTSYLSGSTASSLHETKLASEEFGKEIHVYSPAFKIDEIDEILSLCHSITFNSFNQWQRYKQKALNQSRKISCGIRLNPEHIEVDIPLYNPCAPFSRFGVTKKEFNPYLLEGLEGFHIHGLCGQNSDSLERLLNSIEEKFGEYLLQMKWINLGGGHMITREDYDTSHLINLITSFQKKYNVQIILEPGEAMVLNTGVLATTVIDILQNDMNIAILDTSPTAHMPDVLEMPYRPELIGAGKPSEKAHTYRLGGITCLSGDIIGDYSFDTPLQIDDILVFNDMAQYTIVKNTTFNGIKLPSILLQKENGKLETLREFGYEDFKSRLS